jgi:hypothetical protein
MLGCYKYGSVGGGDGRREVHDTRDEKFAGIKRGGLGASNDAGEKFIFHAVQRTRYMPSHSYIGGESNLL